MQQTELVNFMETLRNNFYYAARNVPKATDDFQDIDRALVWGFNWKLGPFQLWDLMGFDRVKRALKQNLGLYLSGFNK